MKSPSSIFSLAGLSLAFLFLPLFIVLWIIFGRGEPTFQSALAPFQEAGKQAQEDLSSLPAQAFTEDKENFHLVDATPTGMDIRFAGEEKPTPTEEEQKAADAKAFALTFPKDYSKPLEVKLDEKRSVMVTDLGGSSTYTGTLLTDAPTDPPSSVIPARLDSARLAQAGIQGENWFQKILKSLDPRVKPEDDKKKQYLTYTDQDQRKLISYVYQKDQATGEKKLKQWVLYREGSGQEQESYSFQNAKLKKNEDGSINGYFFGEQDLQNQAAKDSVEPSLLERAQRVLSQEMGEDILNSDKTPDFTIPRPYIIDNQGNRTDFDWKVTGDGTTISVLIDLSSLISHPSSLYPIALDPTLSFTVPGNAEGGVALMGEAAGDFFGWSIAAGDFNADGKTDLAVGANSYSTQTGRAYIFYNDGSYTTAASSTDVIITGEATINYFGSSLASGDFNADGKTDLAVGARGYSTSTGRAYIFYNDGVYPSDAASADIIITGETTSNYFGWSLTAGDFNADGKTDLAVGAYIYSSNTGRAYIFYNDGSIPTTAATADVIITGGATSNYFGYSLTAGDFNADGKTDLAVGAYRYSSHTGRAYIFYNDGSIPTTAATADVILTGEATDICFGYSLTAGDFNADGKTDLAVGARSYSSFTGRAYIFYNDGSYPAGAATADVTLTGETPSSFGYPLASGDFNADGKTDLAVGAASNRTYIFYNDGSIPTTAATADVIITGEAASSSIISGDFNADGKADLAVGASGFASNKGKTYIFYSQNGVVNTNQNITGEASSSFGVSLASGDFNADGKTDLAVGASGYSTNTGRVYLFYNDGAYPAGAATADVTLTGETTNNYFGYSFAAGDWNADGKTDLAVGAYGYSTSTGRAYIFYNDGSYPAGAATADVIITGEATENYFSLSLASGDFNSDGKTDLAVGAFGYSSFTGRAYIFYNDGSIPPTAAPADIKGSHGEVG